MKDVAVEIGIAIVTGLGLWVFTSGAEDSKHTATQGLVGDLISLQADVVQAIDGEATKTKNLDALVKENAAVVNAIHLGQGNAWTLALAQTKNLAQFAREAENSNLRIEGMNKRMLEEIKDVKEALVKRVRKNQQIPEADLQMSGTYSLSPDVQHSLDQSIHAV